jgi:hypothetical protein
MNVLKCARGKSSLWSVILAVLVCTSGCHQNHAAQAVPDFVLPQVRGGVFHLHQDHSHTVLLAFLQTVPDTADAPSHQQVGFLRSMEHQYGNRGLKIAIIDSSALVTHEAPARNALVNASYDWQLEFPLLEDNDDRVAKGLGIDQVPTLILLRSDGSIFQRWNGLARPASLAQSIETLLR